MIQFQLFLKRKFEPQRQLLNSSGYHSSLDTVYISAANFKKLQSSIGNLPSSSNTKNSFISHCFLEFDSKDVAGLCFRLSLFQDEDIATAISKSKGKPHLSSQQVQIEAANILFELLAGFKPSSVDYHKSVPIKGIIHYSERKNITATRVILTPTTDIGHQKFEISKASIRFQLQSIGFRNGSIFPILSLNDNLTYFKLETDLNEENTDVIVINAETEIIIHENQNDSSILNLRDSPSISSDTIEYLTCLIHQTIQGDWINAPRILLLYGPPGTGKSFSVRQLAQKMGFQLVSVTIDMVLGSELPGILKQGRLFNNRVSSELDNIKSVILFFDDIDVIMCNDSISDLASQRIAQAHFAEMISSIKSAYAAIPSTMIETPYQTLNNILVIGCTSYIDTMDLSIRRLFEKEILVDLPAQSFRSTLLQNMVDDSLQSINEGNHVALKSTQLSGVSDQCHGFSVSDLERLVRRAAFKLIDSTPLLLSSDSLLENASQIQSPPYSSVYAIEDLLKEEAKNIFPESLTSRSFVVSSSSSSISFDQISGLEHQKAQIKQSTIWIYQHKSSLERLGIEVSKAILLYGPPGTGKTLLAKAVASESNANFLSISISDLTKGEVGASEKAISSLFKLAKQTAPSIIFLDEIQAMFGSRDSSTAHSSNMISQLILELDSLSVHEVVILAATNRPDWIDSSLLRPGRFERCIYVPPPNDISRKNLLLQIMKKMKIDSSVDMESLASDLAAKTQNFTGADLEFLCTKTSWNAIQRFTSKNIPAVSPFDTSSGAFESLSTGNATGLTKADFVSSLSGCHPTVTPSMLQLYEGFQRKHGNREPQAAKKQEEDKVHGKASPNSQPFRRTLPLFVERQLEQRGKR